MFALLSYAGIGYANLITNGDFEVLVPFNDTGGGWTSTNLDIIDFNAGWTAGAGNPGAAFKLNAAGDLFPFTDPTISQSVAGLIPGGTLRR
jgi:hypothetical protein